MQKPGQKSTSHLIFRLALPFLGASKVQNLHHNHPLLQGHPNVYMFHNYS